MRYLTACSGIEAPTAAWHRLGWQPLAFSEIEAFPRAVLKFRYPSVPLHGDLTAVDWSEYRGRADLFAAGTPCQSFSIAGLRKGLADPRGNLTLAFLGAVDAARPRWLVWENVPGILSHDQGRSFGTFLGALGKLGYGFAYRILDAQYFGIPQRRRRVFVVGYLGDWRPAAAVLFEREGLCGHPAPRRQARARVTGSLGGVSPGGGWRCGGDEAAAGQLVGDDVAGALNANGKAAGSATNWDAEEGLLVASTLIPEVSDPLCANEARTYTHEGKNNFRLRNIIPFDTTQVTHPENRSNPAPGDPANTLAKHGHAPAIAFSVLPILEPGRRVGSSETDGRAGDGIGDESGPMFTLNAERPHGVAFSIRSDATREGTALTPSADAEGRVRLRDPGLGIAEEMAPTVDAGRPHAIAFGAKDSGGDAGELAPTLRAMGHAGSHANGGGQLAVAQRVSGVRRLTPMECERLQGMPDGYTLIPVKRVKRPRLNSPKVNADGDARYVEIDGEVWQLAADGPRYKAIGNSMAVPCLLWLGERIELVEALLADLAHAT